MRKIFFVLLFFLALFSFNSVYAATETVRIYPSDTATIRIYDDLGIKVWDDARNYSIQDDLKGPSINLPTISLKSTLTSAGWRIYRHLIRFDTSVVPDTNVDINSVILGVYKTPGESNNEGSDSEVVLTKHTLQAAEYSKANGLISNFTAELARGVLEEGYYTEFSLNDSSYEYINKIGPTTIGALINFDYFDDNPISGKHSATFYGLGNPTSTLPYLEITYTVEDPEPEVDELVLQYAPKLAFYEGVIKGEDKEEWYLPMSVEAFVKESALWDDASETQLYGSSTLSWEKFEEVIDETTDTSDYYLSFSDPDTEGSFDLANAHEKYAALTDADAVYYHKMDDGNYTVLQYWYFYAMNNWKENGGINNHEGDLESVFVFLDKDTKDPEYVAYSAHLNDGDPAFNPKQYDSVRREWDGGEVEKDGDTLTSYVALGSHANYPVAGKHRVFLNKFDYTSDTGERLDTSEVLAGNEINEDDPFWMQYQGKWGANTDDLIGGYGPTGPQYIDVTGQKRFFEPVKWAGIDRIEKFITDLEVFQFLFEKAGVVMNVQRRAATEVWIKVDPHDENVFFGSLPDGVRLLPKFWDITSNMENGTFEAEVAFDYDSDQVDALGGDERTLRVFFYSPDEDEWQPQRTVVDRAQKQVKFKTDHFSRYALGFTEPKVFVGDLFDQIVAVVDGSELATAHKWNLIAQAERLRSIVGESDRRSLTAKEQLLDVFLNIADNKQYRDGFTEAELNDLELLISRVIVMME